MFGKTIKLTLVQKLIVSYAIIVVCLVAAIIYSVTGLATISRIANEIGRVDLAAAEAIDQMKDSLKAQQRAVGRFSIIPDPEYPEIYAARKAAFIESLSVVQRSGLIDVGKLQNDYGSYDNLARKLFAGFSIQPEKINVALDLVEKDMEAVRSRQRQQLEAKLSAARDKEAKTVYRATRLAFSGVVIAIFVAAFLVYSLSASIAKLMKATHRIAAGDFDYEIKIAPGDEIGNLAQDFLLMASRLKVLEQLSLDASPLTRLPGNIAIERYINRLLKEERPFAMCYLDLDNFKSYNDHYGYIKASELLKEAGQVIHEAVMGTGKPDSFVGHIGGDDFVVIVDEAEADAACKSIISGIDGMIPKYYSAADRACGFIDGVDRYGVERSFPLISISIAALVCRPGDYGSAALIASAAAKVKDQVKSSSGSNFIVVEKGDIDDA